MTARKSSPDVKSIPHTRLEEEAMIWESYETGRKLGQGAFGKVYQAKHKETKIEWAIKTVNKEKAGSSAIKLLEREVAILKRVHHSNIIQLNEVYETPKRMFLVMELCEGGELADVLKERKHFPEAEVKVITKELASAIAYLHKNDIVHRDIKLENILISKHPDAADPDNKLQIKVTDFGLSVTKGGVGHDNMMQDFCGTPNYMAPEIIDNKTYSQQCDVWAMGVIVYTLFCGYPPFRSKDEDKLYDLIKKGELDFTDEVWNAVSNEAKECLHGMLEIDPAHRLTASEVVNSHWITGSQDRQSHNVLNLMKMWKDELKNPENDDDVDSSAINGDLSPPTGDVTQPGQDANTEPVEPANKPETESKNGTSSKRNSVDAGSSRRGSGGTKKPGSGGKSSTRTATGKPPTLSTQTSRNLNTPSNLKVPNTNSRVTGNKSPQPSSSRATPTHQTAPRHGAQNMSRATPTPNTPARQTPIGKPSQTSRPANKGNAVHK